MRLATPLDAHDFAGREPLRLGSWLAGKAATCRRPAGRWTRAGRWRFCRSVDEIVFPALMLTLCAQEKRFFTHGIADCLSRSFVSDRNPHRFPIRRADERALSRILSRLPESRPSDFRPAPTGTRLEELQDAVLRLCGPHHSCSRRSRSASRRRKSSASARSRSESWSAYRSSAPGALSIRGVSTLPMR